MAEKQLILVSLYSCPYFQNFLDNGKIYYEISIIQVNMSYDFFRNLVMRSKSLLKRLPWYATKVNFS